MNRAIEQTLFSETPNDGTLDYLTKELYSMIEQRKKENRSIGHIMPGVSPVRDPLIKGLFEINHHNQIGKYHLQYWPLDDPGEEARVLNGSMSLKNLKLNLTHKHVSNKILKKILTIKPHYLSYSKADKILNSIFPTHSSDAVDLNDKYAYASGYNLVGEDMKHSKKEDKIPVERGEMKPVFKGESVPAFRGEMKPIIREETVLAPWGETKPVLKEKIALASRGETKLVSKQEWALASESETKSVLEEELFPTPRSETKPVLKEETILAAKDETKLSMREESLPVSRDINSPSSNEEKVLSTQEAQPRGDEFEKLKETISESRNISSILLDEVESRMNKKSEDTIWKKPDEEVSQGGNWKLQQRIKDFKPSRPYHPTLPPFVRRWPTFRSKPDTAFVPETSTTPPEATLLSTLLTIRPKYSGPRLKPAFFFSDFQRIGTVFPSTSKVAGVETTTMGKLGWKEMCDLLGVGVSQEVLSGALSPERKEKIWTSVKEMFTEEPEEDSVMFDDEEKKFFNPITTEKFLPTTQKTMTTLTPWFLRMTRRQITTTTLPPTTTRHSHLHVIKHHVKKGFTKLLNFFGFGDVESEEIEDNKE